MFASVCGKTPPGPGAAFVADSAVVVGDVTLAPGSTVWYAPCAGGRGVHLYRRKHQCAGQRRPPLRHRQPDCPSPGCDGGPRAIVHGAEVGEGTLIGCTPPFSTAARWARAASSGPGPWCRKARNPRPFGGGGSAGPGGERDQSPAAGFLPSKRRILCRTGAAHAAAVPAEKCEN